MKKPWFIMLGGLLIGVAAYVCVYLTGTASARAINRSDKPALAWLQQEFHLTDQQFARVEELHEAYRPVCGQMCSRIAAKNAELQKLLAATNVVTPEIKTALAEAAQLRAECQAHMLQHFYAVAQTMPPGQRERYLSWVQHETLTPGQMMPSQPPSSPAGMP